MALMRMMRKSVREYAFEALCDEIESGVYPEGSRLPTVKKLSQRFDTSVFTISQALSDLENGGYVICRKGSGTYVQTTRPRMTFADTVVLCMQGAGHFYGDLSLEFAKSIQAKGYGLVLVDTNSPTFLQQLRQLAHAGVKTFIAQYNQQLTGLFTERLFQNRTIVGFLSWPFERLPKQHLVLADFAEGGRLSAKYLYDLGHRSILVVAPGKHHLNTEKPHWQETPERDCRNQGTCFLETAQALGCHIDIVIPDRDPTDTWVYDKTALLAPLRRTQSPATAIFGTMDVVVNRALSTIRAEQPDLLPAIEPLGFYDTPWSQAGDTPFSSVNMQLDILIEELITVLDSIQQNPPSAPITKCICPKLMVR